jgi:hypothetical protein
MVTWLVGSAFTVLAVVQALRGSSWQQWIFAASLFVIATLWMELRHVRAQLAAIQRPALAFGATHIHETDVSVAIKGVFVKTLHGRFPIITLVNDPPATATDPPDAENVTLTLTLQTVSGGSLNQYIARCADTDEPHGGSSSKRELTEHTLAPNGRPWSFNTVVLLEKEARCRPWNNEAMRRLSEEIDAETFLIFAHARGRNVEAKATYQVTTNPLAIKAWGVHA